jgi:hypothetical protein
MELDLAEATKDGPVSETVALHGRPSPATSNLIPLPEPNFG